MVEDVDGAAKLVLSGCSKAVPYNWWISSTVSVRNGTVSIEHDSRCYQLLGALGGLIDVIELSRFLCARRAYLCLPSRRLAGPWPKATASPKATSNIEVIFKYNYSKIYIFLR